MGVIYIPHLRALIPFLGTEGRCQSESFMHRLLCHQPVDCEDFCSAFYRERQKKQARMAPSGYWIFSLDFGAERIGDCFFCLFLCLFVFNSPPPPRALWPRLRLRSHFRHRRRPERRYMLTCS